MYTISQLGEHFNLSRSTLLYYHKIGLLIPSGRSDANYRLYSETDFKRMEQICIYRNAGVPLKAIKELLLAPKQASVTALEKRLSMINREIAALREQQTIIGNLIEQEIDAPHDRVMNKERWVEILRASGLNDEDMHRWHIEFERSAPEAHQDFLESLGIKPDEIDAIRIWSRG